MQIYLLTFPGGKKYIGQTIRSLAQRLREHQNGDTITSSAWAKHGDPDVQILATTDSQEDLDRLEIHYIAEFDTIAPNGYNLALGGHGCSEETRRRMSESNRGRILSEEHKAKLSTAQMGKRHSTETREKISKSTLGKNLGNKHGVGHVRSPEHRAAIGKASRNRVYTPELLAKMRKAQQSRTSYGSRTWTLEQRARMSEKLKANNRTVTPEQRAAHSKRMRRLHAEGRYK